ncbi:transglycosylase SLT domain-containing protein [Kitasatospora sp. NPDC089509]|uniref:transglycosylase SLT domain-containing protein n=1 Tax=Kitasatospora sp. NPDC089509 TaxID=3364079 RepID=UPI0037F82D4F
MVMQNLHSSVADHRPAPRLPTDLVPLVMAAARTCSTLTPSLLASQLHVESNFDPSAVSAAGAKDIAQFTPATWDEFAVEYANGVPPFPETREYVAKVQRHIADFRYLDEAALETALPTPPADHVLTTSQAPAPES